MLRYGDAGEMMGVIGRLRKVPENTKATLMDLKDKGIGPAVVNSAERFGRANREGIKTVGQDARRRK